MTDIEKLKHQRKALDEQIEAAERHELATRLRDTMRALTDNRDLPVEKIIQTVLQTWKDQPDARHTATEFLEILATMVNTYPGAR